NFKRAQLGEPLSDFIAERRTLFFWVDLGNIRRRGCMHTGSQEKYALSSLYRFGDGQDRGVGGYARRPVKAWGCGMRHEIGGLVKIRQRSSAALQTKQQLFARQRRFFG